VFPTCIPIVVRLTLAPTFAPVEKLPVPVERTEEFEVVLTVELPILRFVVDRLTLAPVLTDTEVVTTVVFTPAEKSIPAPPANDTVLEKVTPPVTLRVLDSTAAPVRVSVLEATIAFVNAAAPTTFRPVSILKVLEATLFSYHLNRLVDILTAVLAAVCRNLMSTCVPLVDRLADITPRFAPAGDEIDPYTDI
jgi:hypothetical protein